MNDIEYVAAYGDWEKSIPFSEPEAHRKASARLVDAASPEHAPTVEEVSYMSDQVKCACGWESKKFWDGADYAMKEWRGHVMDTITDTND